MTKRDKRVPLPIAPPESDEFIDLSDLNTRPPRLRSKSITRTKLIDRLQSGHEADVIAVVAPAGYGKTTVVAQWLEIESKPIAWLTLDRVDNDASTLLSHLATALFQAGLIDGGVRASFRFGRPLSISDGLSRIGWALASSQSQGALVLDQVEVIRGRVASEVIRELVDYVDGRIQLVIVSRSSTAIQMAKLRAQARLLEITEEDLALDDDEARRLLAARGIELDLGATTLIERSEGWPVALSLLAIAAAKQTQRGLPAEARGDDRYLAEYFSSEILAHLSPARRDFLTRTSFLDRLTGGLCDAVLERDDSERMLRAVVNKTNLIHPVDRSATWYQMNGLLREALRSELDRQEPEVVRGLNVRAAQWYEDNDRPDLAIHHAHLAGDTERFTRVLGHLIREEYVRGRASRVLQWMAWFEAEVPLGKYPEIAAAGALIHALEGDGLATDHWWAEASSQAGIRGAEMPPVAILVRALGTRDGVETMIADARFARETMAPGMFWIPASLLVEGLGRIWNQDLLAADSLLAEAIALGQEAGAMLTNTLALAERGWIAMSSGDWDHAHHLILQSLRIIEEHALESYATSGLSFALGSRIARHSGDLAHAGALLGRGALARPRLGASIPGLAVQTLVEMAKSCLELADSVGARVLARDARDIVAQRPKLGSLPDQLDDLDGTLASFGSGVVGPSALTKAELRLLPLLGTHLTFPEIGDRLFISRHTVKSQAMSIYRKLGTSSRSEAVARAVESGLLRD